LGSENSEDVAISLEGMFVEKAYPEIVPPRQRHGIGGPVINVLMMEEVVLELLLSDQIGGFGLELGQHANGAGIGLLTPFSFAIELEGLNSSVIPLCLPDMSPFSNGGITPSHEDGFGGIILERTV
jgi:hypothetical protein